MRWLADNYRWLFDGIGALIGATIFTIVGRAIAKRRRPAPPIRAERNTPEPELKLLRFKEPFWYADGDAVPYCSRCWEAHQLQIHLAYAGHMMSGHRYDCPHCNWTYCSSRTPAPATAD